MSIFMLKYKILNFIEAFSYDISSRFIEIFLGNEI